MERITVTIAAKNEQSLIGECIERLQFADEVVVVDDCSDDDTVNIARRLGAVTVTIDSRGKFHNNKNAAIELAKNDWILSLDADEMVSIELADSIRAAVAANRCDGYDISRLNYFLGRPMKRCGWYPDHILRLFRKGKAWWPINIHDTPHLLRDSVHGGVLNGELHHYSYQSFEQYWHKFNAYTTMLADEYAERTLPVDFSARAVYLFIKPVAWFLYKYLRHRGVIAGYRGFFISMSSALAIHASYAKYMMRHQCVMKEKREA